MAHDLDALYGPRYPLDLRSAFDRWRVRSDHIDRLPGLGHRAPEPLLMRSTLLHCSMNYAFGGLGMHEASLIHAAEVTWAPGTSIPLEFARSRVARPSGEPDLHHIWPQIVDHNVHDAHRSTIAFAPSSRRIQLTT